MAQLRAIYNPPDVGGYWAADPAPIPLAPLPAGIHLMVSQAEGPSQGQILLSGLN